MSHLFHWSVQTGSLTSLFSFFRTATWCASHQSASSSFHYFKVSTKCALNFSPAFSLVNTTLTWGRKRNSTFCRLCVLFLGQVLQMSLTVLLVQFLVFRCLWSLQIFRTTARILFFFLSTRIIFMFTAQFTIFVLTDL